MAKLEFTLEDFRDQIKLIRKTGSLKDLMKMIPGLGGLMGINPDLNPEGDMDRIEAIINSMTPLERRHPEKIDGDRQQRIARGAGTQTFEVNRTLKDFQNMARMAQKFSR